jgi:hypothetical protein
MGFVVALSFSESFVVFSSFQRAFSIGLTMPSTWDMQRCVSLLFLLQNHSNTGQPNIHVWDRWGKETLPVCHPAWNAC